MEQQEGEESEIFSEILESEDYLENYYFLYLDDFLDILGDGYWCEMSYSRFALNALDYYSLDN